MVHRRGECCHCLGVSLSLIPPAECSLAKLPAGKSFSWLASTMIPAFPMDGGRGHARAAGHADALRRRDPVGGEGRASHRGDFRRSQLESMGELRCLLSSRLLFSWAPNRNWPMRDCERRLRGFRVGQAMITRFNTFAGFPESGGNRRAPRRERPVKVFPFVDEWLCSSTDLANRAGTRHRRLTNFHPKPRQTACIRRLPTVSPNTSFDHACCNSCKNPLNRCSRGECRRANRRTGHARPLGRIVSFADSEPQPVNGLTE